MSEVCRTGRHRYSVVYTLLFFKIVIILFADQFCDYLKIPKKQKTLIFAAHYHSRGHVTFKIAIYVLYTKILFYCLILPPYATTNYHKWLKTAQPGVTL